MTGGGQISGDPVFSATGDLLSAPALIPSLADPKSQASFGFIVQGSKPKSLSGHLDYKDQAAGVRVKEISYSSLSISNSTTRGPNNHATFTGMAAVTSSTGTTAESFTVDVDDCGDPGTADKFGIATTGTTNYSNGPSTLIGGNIQIHK